MDDNLYRVEEAVSATAGGNLTYETWSYDASVALGFSGQRNPLGFVVVRYLSNPPSATLVWNVLLALAKVLEEKGYAGAEVKEVAWKGFDFWRDMRCRTCFGRGHVDDAHHQCPACGGSGERRLPDGSEPVRAAISALIEAVQWMEGQQRARLKGASYVSSDVKSFAINMPKLDGDIDSGGLVVTPRAPACE